MRANAVRESQYRAMVDFSWLDVVLLIIIAVSAIGGLRRGFLLGCLDLLLFVVALLVGVKLAPWLAESIRARNIPDPLAGAFSFFVMAVLAYAVIGLAVRVLISPIRFLQSGPLGWFNSVLGLIPGAIRGVALASLVSVALLALPPELGFNQLTFDSQFARPLARTGQDMVRAGLELAAVNPADLGLQGSVFGTQPAR